METELTLVQDAEEALISSKQSAPAPLIPGYELRSLLGQGSFGQVWSGVQLATGQVVAIKVLRARGAREWEPFVREVQRLCQVAEHPHVITVLDAGLDQTPAFFVMPMLSGSLAARPNAELGSVVKWLKQAATALRYTHSKGILHCDLKPANLLLDQEENIRIADFGQSVQRGEDVTSFGTLGTMAPEQTGPPPGHDAPKWPGSTPDVSWDMYALGATAYFLLTGVYPRVDGVDRSSYQRLLETYRQAAWTQPLTPVRKLNPRVDRDLAAIVEKCLVSDPTQRLPSAAHLVDELERRATYQPVFSRRPWLGVYLLKRWLQRNPAAPVVGVLIGGAGLAGTLWLGSVLTQPELPENGGLRAYLEGQPGAEGPGGVPVPPFVKGRELPKLPVYPPGPDLYGEAMRLTATQGITDYQSADLWRQRRSEALQLLREARRRPYVPFEGNVIQDTIARFSELALQRVGEELAAGQPDAALETWLDFVHCARRPPTNERELPLALAGAEALEMFLQDKQLLQRCSTPALKRTLQHLETLNQQSLSTEQLYLACADQTLQNVRGLPGYLDRATEATLSQLLVHKYMDLTSRSSGRRPEYYSLADSPSFFLFHPILHRALFYFNQQSFTQLGWAGLAANEARFQGVRLALALELYRREHERLPQELSELVGPYLRALPRDPFDSEGNTFKYHRGLVWSVGLNHWDDHHNAQGQFLEPRSRYAESVVPPEPDMVLLDWRRR